MKCQKCGINDANVSYTRIINGERTSLHLCSECAKEMNINVNFSFGVDDLFNNFFEDFSKIRSLAMPRFMGLRGLDRGFEDMMENSLFEEIPFFKDDIFFESPRRISSSKDELDDVLNNIQKKHKNSKEIKNEKIENQEKMVKKEDKTENKVEDKKQKEIEQLKAKIQEYIKTEEYEKAAVLRDKIKKLSS